MKITRTPPRFLAASVLSLVGCVTAASVATAADGTDTHSVSSLLPGNVFYDSATFFNVVRDSVPFDEENLVTAGSPVQIVFSDDAYAAGFHLEAFRFEASDAADSSDEPDLNLSVTFLDASGNMVGFQHATLSAAAPQFFGAIYAQPFRSIIVQGDSPEVLTDLRYSVKPCMQY